MSEAIRTTEVGRFYVTLDGTQGTGLIGPAIATIEVHEYESYRANYYVYLNGRHWCGGVAAHLSSDVRKNLPRFMVNVVPVDESMTVPVVSPIAATFDISTLT